MPCRHPQAPPCTVYGRERGLDYFFCYCVIAGQERGQPGKGTVVRVVSRSPPRQHPIPAGRRGATPNRRPCASGAAHMADSERTTR